jgi:hypothetical protein
MAQVAVLLGNLHVLMKGNRTAFVRITACIAEIAMRTAPLKQSTACDRSIPKQIEQPNITGVEFVA